MDAFMRTMVRGYKWKCRMFNGAVFEWWTPTKVDRKTARKALYDLANAYCAQDDPCYIEAEGDLESLWQVKP